VVGLDLNFCKPGIWQVVFKTLLSDMCDLGSRRGFSLVELS